MTGGTKGRKISAWPSDDERNDSDSTGMYAMFEGCDESAIFVKENKAAYSGQILWINNGKICPMSHDAAALLVRENKIFFGVRF